MKKYGELSPVYIEGKFYEVQYGFHSWPYSDWQRIACECGSEHWEFEECWECEKKEIDWDAPDIPF